MSIDAIHHRNLVNPGRIEDGHCAMCAFNSYLFLNGEPAKEAFEPGTDNFKTFGDWFYKKFGASKTGWVATVESNGMDFEDYKRAVEMEILQHTLPGESVLLSVDDAHWYVAKNENNTIHFIDSQQGIGFNTYANYDPSDDTEIDIIKIPQEVIDEYHKYVEPKFKGGRKTKRRRKRKSRTHFSRKHSFLT